MIFLIRLIKKQPADQVQSFLPILWQVLSQAQMYNTKEEMH